MSRLECCLRACAGVCLLASGVACFDPDDYVVGEDLQLDDVLTLFLPAPSLPADGDTTVTLQARIPPRANADHRLVTFATTAGSFLPDGQMTIHVTADADGAALARLRAPSTVSSAIVTAEVGGFVRTGTVDFVWAPPDTIEIDPGTFSLRASVNVSSTVTAILRRNHGTTTVGTIVHFTAVDTTGSRIGEFRSNNPSDATGRATALFTVGNTAYRGAVTIDATVEVGPGFTVRGTGRLVVIDQ